MTTALAGARRRSRAPLLSGVVVAVPVVVLVAGAWSRRWMSDDGFINLRIVEQLWAGNGPVWNAEERVETGTSPLWLLVLAVAGGALRIAPVEWVSVLLGMACTVAGLVAAVLAARRLHDAGDQPVVPLGAVVVAALPAFWDFASSGLETGLTFLWIGAGGWALVAALTDDGPAARRRPASAALLGLGPLVRPDLALMAGPALVVLAAREARLGVRRVARLVVAAGALPVAYQLFRMAYFAALVPNTAFAKEGGLSRWDAGWDYAADYVGTWRLWWPAAVLAVVAVPVTARWWWHGPARPAPAAGDRPRVLAAGALTAGAALHAAYVVRVGGDFMHARLLLPATFAAALPWAVVPARRASVLAAAALAPWALAAIVAWQPPGQPREGPATGVVDERAYYTAIAGTPHPVTADDFGASPYALAGRDAAAVAAEGTGQLTLAMLAPADRASWVPRASPAAPFLVAVDNVGVLGYVAGPDVTVLDLRGLGDPLTSRFRLEGERGRPGHEKHTPVAWILGRHADAATAQGHAGADPRASAAARSALGCGELAEVLEAVTEPLGVRRAASNVVLALRSYSLRVSADPMVAEAALCGT